MQRLNIWHAESLHVIAQVPTQVDPRKLSEQHSSQHIVRLQEEELEIFLEGNTNNLLKTFVVKNPFDRIYFISDISVASVTDPHC